MTNCDLTKVPHSIAPNDGDEDFPIKVSLELHRDKPRKMSNNIVIEQLTWAERVKRNVRALP